MALTYSLAAVLTLLSVVLHFEVLRALAMLIKVLRHHRRWSRPLFRHVGLSLAMTGCLLSHAVQVWLFGFAYWWLDHRHPGGGFGGEVQADRLIDFVYFSAVTYTSLGVGDLFPVDHLRLLAGVEALLGLTFIGWTAVFTYRYVEN